MISLFQYNINWPNNKNNELKLDQRLRRVEFEMKGPIDASEKYLPVYDTIYH